MKKAQIKSIQEHLEETLKDCKQVFVYILMLGFVLNLCMLALPIYSLQVLDRVISSGSTDTLLLLSIIIIAALIFFAVMLHIRSVVFIRLGNWLNERLSGWLVSHSISSASLHHEATGSQQVRDFDVIRRFLTGQEMTSLCDIPWSLIFIITLFLIHPLFGLITVLGMGMLFVLALISDKTTKDYLDIANKGFVRAMNHIEIATRNAEAIEAMGMGKQMVKLWNDANRDVMYHQTEGAVRSSIITSVTRATRMTLQVIIVGAGAYLVLHGSLSVGAMIAAMILSGRAFSPVESIIGSWKGLIGARKSYQRLEESLACVPVRKESLELPKPKGKIELEKVTYVPTPGASPILRNIQFSIEPGEFLGVIGPSASGKTSLAKILVGVWHPTIGTARLDGADIYSWNRDSFGAHVGYVPQDIELFNGTVKDNIARMDKDADAEDIIKAAMLTGVHDMILHLPEGYETNIGVGGEALSAGQRQRVALARAFYGDPQFIVMDEPNSNLDHEGDGFLIQALQAAKKAGKTVIAVTHRPSLLVVFDKILILNQGKMEGFGPRDEILKKIEEKRKQLGIASGKV